MNKVIDSDDIATGETMNVLGYSLNSRLCFSKAFQEFIWVRYINKTHMP